MLRSHGSLLGRRKHVTIDVRIVLASAEIDILDPSARTGGVLAGLRIVDSALLDIQNGIAFEPQLALGPAGRATVKLLILCVAINLVARLPTVGLQPGAHLSIGCGEFRSRHLRLRSADVDRVDTARVLGDGSYVVIAASRKFGYGAVDAEIEDRPTRIDWQADGLIDLQA